MIKFLRKLFGYQEAVVVKKTLDIKKGYRKAYGISWKNVAHNFIQLMKNWPRNGQYKKFYYRRHDKPDDVVGYIRPELVKDAINHKTDGVFMGGYLVGHIYPDINKGKKDSWQYMRSMLLFR